MRVGELKVYDGVESVNGKEARVIVAATSQRTAVAALAQFGIGISVRRLMTYWTISSDQRASEIALSQPGQAFGQRPDNAFYPLPRRAVPQSSAPAAPKVPKDPDGRRQYDKEKREDSDATKRARGERRLTSWLPKEAADALDQMTGGSAERGAVREALTAALLAYTAKQPTAKRKA